jgi:hypothetical protein
VNCSTATHLMKGKHGSARLLAWSSLFRKHVNHHFGRSDRASFERSPFCHFEMGRGYWRGRSGPVKGGSKQLHCVVFGMLRVQALPTLARLLVAVFRWLGLGHKCPEQSRAGACHRCHREKSGQVAESARDEPDHCGADRSRNGGESAERSLR